MAVLGAGSKGVIHVARNVRQLRTGNAGSVRRRTADGWGSHGGGIVYAHRMGVRRACGARHYRMEGASDRPVRRSRARV